MPSRRHVVGALSAAAFALVALSGLSSTPAAAAAACDRACLGGLITTYVDALVAHDPSALPLAPGARFTEDSHDLKLGEGLWRTVTAKGQFRQDYLDERKQIAATHVEVREGAIPVLYSVLLHVKDRKIAGVETLVQRILPDSPFQPTELGRPIRGMNDPVPAAARQSRASMIKTALTYAEGLRIGDFTAGHTPFAPETYRVENGVITAGDGCGRADCGMYTQKILKHPAIKAEPALVDEANGVVVLWMNFGDTNSYGPGNALVTFEAFKVWGNQIHAINAFFHPLPVATQRGWAASD